MSDGVHFCRLNSRGRVGLCARNRTRTVVKQPAYGGAACNGPLQLTEPCGDRDAPVGAAQMFDGVTSGHDQDGSTC